MSEQDPSLAGAVPVGVPPFLQIPSGANFVPGPAGWAFVQGDGRQMALVLRTPDSMLASSWTREDALRFVEAFKAEAERLLPSSLHIANGSELPRFPPQGQG